LDEGNGQFVRGWAAAGSRALDVTVCLRGIRFSAPPCEDRPDLVPLGLPLRSGFKFVFPDPLSDGESVHVQFPNGKEIQNSPFIYSGHQSNGIFGADETLMFSDEYPSHQNSIDIFRNAWSSAMPKDSGLESGGGDLHFEDTRVPWGASLLGSLKGKSILELGPFEAYNSYQLEQLGARVLSIEGNPVNFTKCLIVKNALSMSATFLLGDFTQFLESSNERFDVCWASGVLYHAKDPIRLLRATCRVAPTIFLWTHYFDEEIISSTPDHSNFFRPSLNKRVKTGNREITLHYRSYLYKKGQLYSGGPDDYSYWMSKDDIISLLAEQGFVHVVMGVDNPQFFRGPACFFLASRLPILSPRV
jgi:SAM-dependent methyltransferase